MIDLLLSKFEEAGIPLQITLDFDKEATVHAFDLNRELHLTTGNTLFSALEKMAEKLL
ncbi:hypothetical protein [Sporosarcina globispora]|uniref:hypothetical protein n=1 Tax=Sporosarcina globispora TaxID=1459 RepID=UPI000B19ACB6|nr:hypothetical protein [Sporosarcina globispora]